MKKYIITAFLAFGIFAACVIPVHAASAGSVVSLVKDMFGVCLETVNSGEDDWVAARNQINSHWLSYSSVSSMGRLYLSYDVMSNLAAELNGQGFPCRLEYNRNLQLYVICGVGEVGSVPGVSVTGLYLTNGSRDLFCCEYNTDTLLSSISSKLTTVSDNLSTLINKATSIQSSLTDVVNYLSASTQSLARLSNTFNSDFSAYFLDIWNDISDISSKLDTIAANVYTSSGGSSSVLPDEYRRLSYIETNGQQYINTSIYFDSAKSLQLDADVEFTSSDVTQVLFGYQSASSDDLYSLCINPYLPTKSYCTRFGRDVTVSSGAFPTGSRHSISSYAVSGQQYFSIDGVTTLTSSITGSFSSSVPCSLFAMNSYSGNVRFYSYVRCYGAVIRQSGAVIRNYIPALRYSDNVPGLYDLVSGEFFPSAGKRFIAGPVMSSWTYDFLSRISSTLYSIETKLSSVSSSSYSSCWCTEDSVSSSNVSDVGYSSLSSLLSFALSNGTDLQVYDGVNGYFNLEDLYSVEIVQATVGSRTGYYLRAFGQFYRSVDAVNQYYTCYLYLGMPGGGGGSELFYASSDSLGDGSDLTGVIARLDTIIGKLGTSSGSDLTTLESTAASIESTLSIINDKLDNTATKIENTTVNITNNNSAYNVFYVTDEDGNEHSITSVAGDSLSAGGKLLNFLYKLVVDGALSGVDGAVDGLGDFFFDSNPSGLGEGVSVWD